MSRIQLALNVADLEASIAFYTKLFEIAPDYKTTLFARTNIKAQAKMLASTIDTAVKHLRKPDVLVPESAQNRTTFFRTRTSDEINADPDVAEAISALQRRLTSN